MELLQRGKEPITQKEKWAKDLKGTSQEDIHITTNIQIGDQHY